MRRSVGIALGDRRVAASLLILTAIVAGGCRSAPGRWTVVLPVSRSGTNLYLQAKHFWAQVKAEDPRGQQLANGMQEVIVRLRSAVDHDPSCALFHSKIGDIWLSLGPEYRDRAKAAYDQAHALCEQWVPAWLGWAELAYEREDVSAMRQALEGAVWAMRAIQNQVKRAPNENVFTVLGLMPAKFGPTQEQMTPEQERQTLIAWVNDSEQWALDNLALLDDPVHAQPGRVTADQVFARLRARIALYDAKIAALQKAPLARVVQALDKSLAEDTNFLQARLAMAAAMHRQKKYQAAVAILQPYVTSDNPMLARNRVLLGKLAAVYGDWYLDAGDRQLLLLAERYYEQLQKRHPNDVPSLIGRADLLIHTALGKPEQREKIFATVRRYLDRAQVHGGDAQQIEQLRGKLATEDPVIGH